MADLDARRLDEASFKLRPACGAPAGRDKGPAPAHAAADSRRPCAPPPAARHGADAADALRRQELLLAVPSPALASPAAASPTTAPSCSPTEAPSVSSLSPPPDSVRRVRLASLDASYSSDPLYIAGFSWQAPDVMDEVMALMTARNAEEERS